MATSTFGKIIFFCLNILSAYSLAQERSRSGDTEQKIITVRLNNVDFLVQNNRADYEEIVCLPLLQFTHLAQTNQLDFLQQVPEFYKSYCQTTEKRTWNAYVQSPLLNAKKLIGYLGLMRTAQQKVYLPIARKIIDEMNHRDPELDASEFQKKRDAYQEELGNLPDNPLLAQKSAELVAQEWPFQSVEYDLRSHACQIEAVKKRFELEVQKLIPVEQTDRKISDFQAQLTNHSLSLSQAIHTLVNRSQIQEILKKPLEFIHSAIASNSLAQEITCLRKTVNMSTLNKSIKEQTGMPLIHFICLHQGLTVDQKKEIVETLLPDQNINETDKHRKTVLDYIPADDGLFIFLRSKNALHSISPGAIKKSVLKKSYDSPPTSPAPEGASRRLQFDNSVKSSP